MASPLCFDANVLVKLYVAEPDSPLARQLVVEELEKAGRLLGPTFLPIEVLSVVRQKVHRGVLGPDTGERAAAALLATPVEEVGGPEVYRRAWEIAAELAMPTIYDAVYLAVAEVRGATFWTADRKLFNLAKGRGYVHLLGETSA